MALRIPDRLIERGAGHVVGDHDAAVAARRERFGAPVGIVDRDGIVGHAERGDQIGCRRRVAHGPEPVVQEHEACSLRAAVRTPDRARHAAAFRRLQQQRRAVDGRQIRVEEAVQERPARLAGADDALPRLLRIVRCVFIICGGGSGRRCRACRIVRHGRGRCRRHSARGRDRIDSRGRDLRTGGARSLELAVLPEAVIAVSARGGQNAVAVELAVLLFAVIARAVRPADDDVAVLQHAFVEIAGQALGHLAGVEEGQGAGARDRVVATAARPFHAVVGAGVGVVGPALRARIENPVQVVTIGIVGARIAVGGVAVRIVGIGAGLSRPCGVTCRGSEKKKRGRNQACSCGGKLCQHCHDVPPVRTARPFAASAPPE